MNTRPILDVICKAVRPNGLTAFALGVILLLAFGLRLWNITESLWIDELHTSWTVSGGFADVFSRAAWGNQPPLFYWFVWIVQGLFGESEFTLRLPSLVAGLALVVGLAWIVWLLTENRFCVVMAAFIGAIDVDLVFYSQEARPYALIQWLTVVHFLAFLFYVRRMKSSVQSQTEARDASKSSDSAESLELPISSTNVVDSKRIRLGIRAIWVATLVAAFYSHYTALIIIMPELILMVGMTIANRRESLRVWKPLLMDAGIACVLCLPSVFHLREIAARGDDWAVLMQTWPLPISFARGLLVYVVPTLVLLSMVAWARRGHWRYALIDPQRFASSSVVWLLAVSLPVVVCWASARMDLFHVFLPRYLMALLPLACLVPVLAFDEWWRAASSEKKWPRRRIWIGGVLIICFIAFESPLINAPWPTGRLAIHRGEDWRLAVGQFPQPSSESTTVFLFPSLVEDGRLVESTDEGFEAYTSFALNGLYELPERKNETDHAWDVRTRATVRSPRLRESDVRDLVAQGSAWLIVRGNYDTLEPILNEFADQLSQVGLTFDALVDVYGSVLVVELEVLEPEELQQRQQAIHQNKAVRLLATDAKRTQVD